MLGMMDSYPTESQTRDPNELSRLRSEWWRLVETNSISDRDVRFNEQFVAYKAQVRDPQVAALMRYDFGRVDNPNLDVTNILRLDFMVGRNADVGHSYAVRAFRLAKIMKLHPALRSGSDQWKVDGSNLPTNHDEDWQLRWCRSLSLFYPMYAGLHAPPSDRNENNKLILGLHCPCGRAAAGWRDRVAPENLPSSAGMPYNQCGINGISDVFDDLEKFMGHLRFRDDEFHEAAYCYMAVMFCPDGQYRRLAYRLANPM